jgi:hypothetical protein
VDSAIPSEQKKKKANETKEKEQETTKKRKEKSEHRIKEYVGNGRVVAPKRESIFHQFADLRVVPVNLFHCRKQVPYLLPCDKTVWRICNFFQRMHPNLWGKKKKSRVSSRRKKTQFFFENLQKKFDELHIGFFCVDNLLHNIVSLL